MQIFNKAVPSINESVRTHNKELVDKVDAGEITMEECLAQSVAYMCVTVCFFVSLYSCMYVVRTCRLVTRMCACG